MIRFAHISDTHLGYTSGKKVDEDSKINLREVDGYKAFKEALQQIIEQKVDFVLHTGDFFHSPNPSMRTIVYSQIMLRELTKAGIPFYCLAGNHDSTDAKKDIPSSVVLHAPEAGIYSYSNPYKIVHIGERLALHLVSHHGYTAQKDTMKKVAPLENKINILCSHGSCFDSYFGGVLHTDAEPREIVIPEEVLALDWDYTLLGHIHTRGWVHSADGKTDTENKKVFYGGSLFRRGFSDEESPLGRGWTLWTVDESTKEMTPTFFQVKQRNQLEVVVSCKDKEALEIEDALESLLSKIDYTEAPVLRVILDDISSVLRTQINWKKFEPFISQCLTFNTKFSTVNELKKLNLSGEIFSFDLIDAYQAYWKEADKKFQAKDRELINDINIKLLKMGQDKVLETSPSK